MWSCSICCVFFLGRQNRALFFCLFVCLFVLVCVLLFVEGTGKKGMVQEDEDARIFRVPEKCQGVHPS